MAKKWIAMIICLAVVAALLCGCQATFAEYFEEAWLDKIESLVAVLLGAVSAVAVVLSKVRKGSKDVQATLSSLKERKELLDVARGELAKAEALYKETVDNLNAQLALLLASRQLTAEQIEGLSEMVSKLREGLTIALCNDPDLVESGHAKEIVKLWEVDGEEQA
ncbi:MAG: hypothetical protein J5755_05135 [Clostridia bacterium]|nr:hypothetical protein [Clostridia bacterium]